VVNSYRFAVQSVKSSIFCALAMVYTYIMLHMQVSEEAVIQQYRTMHAKKFIQMELCKVPVHCKAIYTTLYNVQDGVSAVK